MDAGDDPEERIAELERQLADAKAAAGQGYREPDQSDIGPPPVFFGASGRGGPAGFPRQRPRRKLSGANLFGAIAGFIGFCAGGAAALTAALPSSALWTSRIVCGGPNQLMVNTSHYSYKPNQSGTAVDFQCLRGDGAYDASWFTITALQTLAVALVVAGAVAAGAVIRRLARQEPVSRPIAILAGGLGLAAVVVAVALAWQGFSSSSLPTQMPHGGTLAIKGNGETKTIACNDGHLTVDGRDMTVTVTGHCARVSVDGVIHHITVDSADAIDVDGVNNVVTYHSGSPQITKSGAQNTVQQG